MSAVVPKFVDAKEISSPETSSHSKLATLLTPARRGPRNDEIRVAEYAPFPRESADQQPRIGFTRDVSALGMCLGVEQPEAVGALLRVDVRRLDGESVGASIARVVWTKGSRDGRHWLGLDLLCETDAKRRADAASA
jgi:hypothetical protein